MTSNTPKTSKLLSQLLRGRRFSEQEISKNFGLKGARQAISRIREEGYDVEAVKVKSKGNTVTKYAIVG